MLGCRVVAQCTAPGTGLPFDKPRYVMGIGYPLDIVICSGTSSMLDTVMPSQQASMSSKGGWAMLVRFKLPVECRVVPPVQCRRAAWAVITQAGIL